MFGFFLDDLYGNIEIKWSGELLIKEEVCKNVIDCLDLKKKDNIVGKFEFLRFFLWFEEF